ncbi:Large exoprotein involved in heme utilization or adhesion [Serpentinimonas maccroryi]|uniref:Large exoprotein involved in heme utilization or adhesion n=1 Tax=Serpentinimonas maccroryi TaxID=1458426 RepID=A0A060NY97_9BURK|nr:Large exoprotein involved in heme utilization or adhesion [Serpentinimonas maccroryi]
MAPEQPQRQGWAAVVEPVPGRAEAGRVVAREWPAVPAPEPAGGEEPEQGESGLVWVREQRSAAAGSGPFAGLGPTQPGPVLEEGAREGEAAAARGWRGQGVRWPRRALVRGRLRLLPQGLGLRLQAVRPQGPDPLLRVGGTSMRRQLPRPSPPRANQAGPV